MNTGDKKRDIPAWPAKMLRLRVAIRACEGDGWYAQLRECAGFWTGDLPLEAEGHEALAPLGLTLSGATKSRELALVGLWGWLGTSDGHLPDSGYVGGRIALQRYREELFRRATDIASHHRSRRWGKLRAELEIAAIEAGLLPLGRGKRGRPRRMPDAGYAASACEQGQWLVGQVVSWAARVEEFAGQFGITVSQAWDVRFPMLAPEERKALLERRPKGEWDTRKQPRRVAYCPSFRGQS